MSVGELRLEHYTPAARLLLARAQAGADASGHHAVTPLHLFGELLAAYPAVFRQAGANTAHLLERVEMRLSMEPRATAPAVLDQALLGLLGRAERSALAENAVVGLEHVVGALFEERVSLAILAGVRVAPQGFIGVEPAGRIEPRSEVAYLFEGRKLLRGLAERQRAARSLDDDDATRLARARRLLDAVAYQLTYETVPDLDLHRETSTRVALTPAGGGGAIIVEWQPSLRMIVMTSRANASVPTQLSRYAWVGPEGRWARSSGDGDFFEDLVTSLDKLL